MPPHDHGQAPPPGDTFGPSSVAARVDAARRRGYKSGFWGGFFAGVGVTLLACGGVRVLCPPDPVPAGAPRTPGEVADSVTTAKAVTP